MKIIPLVIIAILLTILFLGCAPRLIDTLEFEGTVTDIRVSAGGWGSPSIATVYWDNGKVVNFKVKHTTDFVIGQKYHVVAIKLHPYASPRDSCWRIKELNRR